LQNCEEPFLDFRHLEEEELDNLIHIVSDICEDLLNRDVKIIIKVGDYELM
jgi:hypothetical protein